MNMLSIEFMIKVLVMLESSAIIRTINSYLILQKQITKLILLLCFFIALDLSYMFMFHWIISWNY
jgi:hypothetical protein